MPSHRKVTKCPICLNNESKYSCPTCLVRYCSVSCFKQHKEETCSRHETPKSYQSLQTVTEVPSKQLSNHVEEAHLEDPKPLRPLTSLKWPYIPDGSEYPDPLKRDDPKTLQLRHYEAIATSPTVRNVLATYPKLKTLLTSINSLHGIERGEALQSSLGVLESDIKDLSAPQELSDEILAFRELAGAIEAAVRDEDKGLLGLDWDAGD